MKSLSNEFMEELLDDLDLMLQAGVPGVQHIKREAARDRIWRWWRDTHNLLSRGVDTRGEKL